MSLISTDEFLNLLRRSKIVEAQSLEKALHFLQAQGGGQLVSESSGLADQLVELGLITHWQAEKLLARRYKGFFLGRYKLLDQIGSGGMSRVFLAEHQMLHRRRALKVLPRERVRDSTYLARFQLEARAIAALDHPNIVRAYDIDSVGDIHYLVMEYIEGPDLQQLVEHDGPLDYQTAAAYIAQAARGLHHAHQAGLIHRDVKPANILVAPQQVIKVLDLGLALFHEITDESSLTITHNEKVLGTADYLAPEQALDSHSIDHRADLYGLGCTLYFALTGAPPFPDGSIAQRIARHQSRMPPPLSTHRPDCPAELEEICFRLMRKKPEERYDTALVAAEALEQFVQHQSVVAPPVSAQAEAARDLAVAGVPLAGTAIPSTGGRGSSSSGEPRTGFHSPTGGMGELFPNVAKRPRPDDTLADRARETVKGLPAPGRVASDDGSAEVRPDLGESPRPGETGSSARLEAASSESRSPVQIVVSPARPAPTKRAPRRRSGHRAARRIMLKLRAFGNRFTSWCRRISWPGFSSIRSGRRSNDQLKAAPEAELVPELGRDSNISAQVSSSAEGPSGGRWVRGSFSVACLASLLLLLVYAVLTSEWLSSWPFLWD